MGVDVNVPLNFWGSDPFPVPREQRLWYTLLSINILTSQCTALSRTQWGLGFALVITTLLSFCTMHKNKSTQQSISHITNAVENLVPANNDVVSHLLTHPEDDSCGPTLPYPSSHYSLFIHLCLPSPHPAVLWKAYDCCRASKHGTARNNTHSDSHTHTLTAHVLPTWCGGHDYSHTTETTAS